MSFLELVKATLVKEIARQQRAEAEMADYVPSWAKSETVAAPCEHPNDAGHAEAGYGGWCLCPCPLCYAATHPWDPMLTYTDVAEELAFAKKYWAEHA